MNRDYKVVVSISHHRISFEYWLRGGGDDFQSVETSANSSGRWPVPLSVYIPSNGNLVIGEEASIAASCGISNAFSNVFGRMSNPSETYDIYGEKKRICFLLLDAAEVVFRDFFNKTPYLGNLEQNRSTMPLVFVCEDDIQYNDRALLLNMFRQSGFASVVVENYQTFVDKFIQEEIAPRYNYKNALTIWNEGGDMYVTLFSMRGDENPISCKLAGLGVDPRQSKAEEKIWRDLKAQYPYLDIEENQGQVAQAAKNFLSSTNISTSGTLIVDGYELTYNLDKNSINHFQYSSKQAMLAGIKAFLGNNQIEMKDTLLILRGDVAHNDYFAEALGEFPQIIRSNSELRSKVMKAIIDLPVPDGVVIEPAPVQKEVDVRQPQTSSSTASNDDGWGSTNGFNTGSFDGFKTSGFGEVNTGGMQPTPPVQEPPQPKQPNPAAELQREWRQVTAKVNGMLRSAFYDKALAELEPFLKQCEQQGATDLIPLVTEKIAAVKELRDKESDNTEEIAKLTREWRPLKATANAKVRTGKAQEGKVDFETFLKRCEQAGAKELIAEVKAEIAKISTAPPPPPQPPVSAGDMPRDWRNLKATANAKVRGGKVQEAVKEFEAFLKKCEQAGAKDLIPLVKAEIAKAKGGGSTTPPPTPPVTPPPANTGSLVREWKQAKAAAGGKIRAQKNAEAKKILQDFLAKCTTAGAKDIIAEVKAELAKVK